MKRINIFYMAAALLIAPAIGGTGSSPQELFTEGNQAYEKGELDRALESYLTLARQGWGGAALYYNLGNVTYKKGERGSAILWYERALRQNPRDADIQFNLSLARSHLKEENSDFIEKILFTFSDRELGLAVLVLVWVFFGLLGGVFLKRVDADSWAGTVLWITGSFLILTSGWLGARLTLESKPWAVVVSPPGEVRNGPGIDYAVGFTIPEGSKVLILNKRPEWSQVGVPQEGLKGWMPTKDVEPITFSPKIS